MSIPLWEGRGNLLRYVAELLRSQKTLCVTASDQAPLVGSLRPGPCSDRRPRQGCRAVNQAQLDFQRKDAPIRRVTMPVTVGVSPQFNGSKQRGHAGKRASSGSAAGSLRFDTPHRGASLLDHPPRSDSCWRANSINCLSKLAELFGDLHLEVEHACRGDLGPEEFRSTISSTSRHGPSRAVRFVDESSS